MTHLRSCNCLVAAAIMLAGCGQENVNLAGNPESGQVAPPVGLKPTDGPRNPSGEQQGSAKTETSSASAKPLIPSERAERLRNAVLEMRETQKRNRRQSESDRNAGTASNSEGRLRSRALPGGLPAWFKEYDRDGDGQVAMFEWPAEKLEEFKRYDGNGDGLITSEEVLRVGQEISRSPAGDKASPEKPRSSDQVTVTKPSAAMGEVIPKDRKSEARQFRMKDGKLVPVSDSDRSKGAEGFIREADKNADGKLSPEEFPAFRQQFGEWDTNKDGLLDGQELSTGIQRTGLRAPSSVEFGSPEQIRDAVTELLTVNDRDKDGKLSRQEAPDRLQKQLSDFDTNKDGLLDAQELTAAIKELLKSQSR